MIARRNSSKSPLVIAKAAAGTYTVPSNNTISGTGRKLINSHSGSVQVHLGKNQTDSKVFLDFRLSILVDDFLLMFKNKYSDEILAISIPKEFASKFVVSSTVPKKT